MNGSKIVSEEEKQEMLRDAADCRRGQAFMAARRKSQEGGLDDYIDFLSENIGIMESRPTRKKTDNYRL
jgi:hypothetical protein